MVDDFSRISDESDSGSVTIPKWKTIKNKLRNTKMNICLNDDLWFLIMAS